MNGSHLNWIALAGVALGLGGAACGPVASDNSSLANSDLVDGKENDLAVAVEALAGTWLLENQSTWNEVTLDVSGTVIAGQHPHGVSSIQGSFTLREDGLVEGAYTIIDEESLDNIPPQPQGTWTVTMTGQLAADLAHMELDYTLEYIPEGQPPEIYTGTWQASKQ